MVGGGIAPIVSIALVQAFHTAFAVSGYVLAALVLTLLALWLAPDTSRVNHGFFTSEVVTQATAAHVRARRRGGPMILRDPMLGK